MALLKSRWLLAARSCGMGSWKQPCHRVSRLRGPWGCWARISSMCCMATMMRAIPPPKFSWEAREAISPTD